MKADIVDDRLLADLRRDTPATRDIVHFNNAGASLMPNPVFEAVTHYLEAERMQGGYAVYAAHKAGHDRFYTSFAELLGTAEDEIAYVHSATHAWHLAFHSLQLTKGDEIITHASDFASNHLSFLQMCKRNGVIIRLAPSDSSGALDPEGLEGMINAKTRLIAITHAPAQGGLINPVEDVGQIARAHGITYMLDACQSVGQMQVSVPEIGCDILTGTGRKFLRGPRGTGFLYVSRDLANRLDPPFVDMASANWASEFAYELAPGVRRFEGFENNYAGRMGLAAAAEYALAIGIANIEARIVRLSGRLCSKLADIPGVILHDLGKRKSGIVSFIKDGTDPNALVSLLAEKRIQTSAVPAHLARFDLGARGLSGVARASVHYFNTNDEIDKLCEAVRAC